MATFRTDPETGKTVISEANRVDRPISDYSSSDAARTLNRLEGDPRSGGFGPPVLQDPGTGYMTRQEFETVSGMTDTNPYGNDGFFSRVFGIDPRKIDYTSNLGPRGIENVKRQAYDRFMNPFARVDAFGRPTMGANAALGTTRSGVQPGDLTVFGPAVEARQEGIAGLFQNTLLGSMMPKRARIPGYDTNVLVPELGLGGPQPGEGVDPAQRFGAQSEVDYSGMGNELLGVNPPRVDERLTPMSFPGNVDDLGNELGDFPAPEDPYAFEDRRAQRQAAARPAQTVAEILMEEPPYTGPFTSQIAEDIFMSGADTPIGSAPQGIGTGSTGGATVQRDAAPFEESMGEIERGGARSDLLMDIIEQLRRDNPLTDVAPPVPQSGGQIDLVGTLPPRPMMTPTPRPSRGIDPRAASLALELERLARERAMQ